MSARFSELWRDQRCFAIKNHFFWLASFKSSWNTTAHKWFTFVNNFLPWKLSIWGETDRKTPAHAAYLPVWLSAKIDKNRCYGRSRQSSLNLADNQTGTFHGRKLFTKVNHLWAVVFHDDLKLANQKKWFLMAKHRCYGRYRQSSLNLADMRNSI